MNKERIPKLVIKPCDIQERKGSFQICSNENLVMCYDCKSPLFYTKIDWGVVAEDNEYGIINNKSNRVYSLREIGLVLYCAECGSFLEHYGKYFYPENNVVFWDFDFDEIDSDERAEIECCLNQFNQKGTFEARYKSNIFVELKAKLLEYEKAHPVTNGKEKEKGKRGRPKKKTN